MKKLAFIPLFFLALYGLLLYKVCGLLGVHNNIFLVAYTVGTSVYLVSRFAISAFYHDDHREEPYYIVSSWPKKSRKEYPSVSFVIACKNEEDSIRKTIDACLSADYPQKMDCVAVNDGSTDNTLAEMMKAKVVWGDKLHVTSFPQNKGKREAMAAGVLASSGEIIVFVDSDSFVAKDSVRLIAGHFMSDEKVAAVSGNTLVENATQNTLTRMQAAKYGVAFEILKACESVFNVVTCCPGCFSAYRRDAVVEVLDEWRNQTLFGSRSTFGDDRGLTNYMLKNNHKVLYCRSAKATTIVPSKWRTFFKQQLRWKKSWLRETLVASKFMWKKHPIASISFYSAAALSVICPFIVARIFLLAALSLSPWLPLIYVSGAALMGATLGLFSSILHQNEQWIYTAVFTPVYAFVLVWQMPYALLKIRDTQWGTR